MTYSITFHPQALEEYRAASIWYEAQQEGLGLRFEKAIDNKIVQVLHSPLVFSKCKGLIQASGGQGVSICNCYAPNSREKEVYVSAIYHTSRNPRAKYRRL